MYFFFFQAEDGIRDLIVTGVQTCALPISSTRDGSGTPDDAPGGVVDSFASLLLSACGLTTGLPELFPAATAGLQQIVLAQLLATPSLNVPTIVSVPLPATALDYPCLFE